MIGGYFDEHPWGTFDAPVIVEDPAFPGMKQWPSAFTINDEIYQIKDFSRTTTRVLMRLDPSKLDLTNPRVHRAEMQTMIVEAIKWLLRLVDADVTLGRRASKPQAVERALCGGVSLAAPPRVYLGAARRFARGVLWPRCCSARRGREAGTMKEARNLFPWPGDQAPRPASVLGAGPILGGAFLKKSAYA